VFNETRQFRGNHADTQGRFAHGRRSRGGEPRRRDARAQSAPSTVKTPVNFDVPRGAVDSHTHVFPDPQKFPFWSGRAYTPPVATADDLLALQKALHMDHVVIVTPSVYGTDNSATLDGIKQLGPERARGVAVIDEKTSAADVDAMHKGGIRGIRGIRGILETGVFDTAVAAKKLDAAVQQVRGAHGIFRSMRDYRSSIR
jgi:predicted TIM-barrel fold metal-dependent hydrolase